MTMHDGSNRQVHLHLGMLTADLKEQCTILNLMEQRDVLGLVPYGKYDDRTCIASSQLRTTQYMMDVEAKIQALYKEGKRGNATRAYEIK